MGNKEFSVDDFDWTVKLISEGSETQNAEKELLELRDKYYEEMAKAVALPKRFLMTPNLSTQEDKDRWSFFWYTLAVDWTFALQCRTNRWPTVWHDYWKKRLTIPLVRGKTA